MVGKRSFVLINVTNCTGNYIISGGHETVLVLWQLETGRTQTLPHLTATIKGITVSPSGTSYALRLDDNSVVVLSTSELTPTAVIAGLQSPGLSSTRQSLMTHLKSHNSSLSLGPAVANVQSPNQILLAVPASQHFHGSIMPSPFLQTYDITVGRHVSRQALARNNVTNFNIGPDSKPIREANVTLMKVSHDGMWLAAAEEWSPTVPQDGDVSERRETYLKFWRWQSPENQWVLESRIDSPHQADVSSGANRILDLDSDPTKVGFATVGQDGITRIWSPKTRRPGGRIVKGLSPKGQTIWVCSRAVDLGKSIDNSDPDGDSQLSKLLDIAKLAYSDDSSVLAVSLDNKNALAPGLVHFVDTTSGDIRTSQPLVYGTCLAGMQFIGRHLVVLSTELRVWDVVTNKLVYGYPLKQGNVPMELVQAFNQLAANRQHSRYAVSFLTAVSSIDEKLVSRVAVFDPTSPRPCLIVDIENIIASIIPLNNSLGFALIDNESQIRHIKPDSVASMDPLQLGMSLESETIDSLPQHEMVKSDIAMELDDEKEENDGSESESDDEAATHKPVVRGHQLADIFDSAPAFALPPVHELFKAVAGLYIGKRKDEKSNAVVGKTQL
jgi:NET1-associated nuclear protein 1 (U3 small nucleolar RNA-associated protein 17)